MMCVCFPGLPWYKGVGEQKAWRDGAIAPGVKEPVVLAEDLHCNSNRSS